MNGGELPFVRELGQWSRAVSNLAESMQSRGNARIWQRFPGEGDVQARAAPESRWRVEQHGNCSVMFPGRTEQ